MLNFVCNIYTFFHYINRIFAFYIILVDRYQCIIIKKIIIIPIIINKSETILIFLLYYTITYNMKNYFFKII